ncbi:MAG: hypothetical protein ONB48_16270 [candidate division KSB1 bacterium]|nr:hypothetical protein [candidate division KSB1 bacterium]MDZ7274273.1 hypothetical protein [candidate division KSB1 bacterium]MDZ7287205.1 hypothetical protein [candidate division KSB1 bacterium]MDZ7296870.1 hypothetical protein [candidate division KSB1 bacterium]MDZ7306025.1 hypothetical protein [candidate division KSB1 bacterium]
MRAKPEAVRKLTFIKTAHTVIWAFFVVVIGYILYAGIFNELDIWVWIAIGLIILEGVVLLRNSGHCPLTLMAAKYTANRDDNFDIFLPNWLARHNKIIFGTIGLAGVMLVIYRVMT